MLTCYQVKICEKNEKTMVWENIKTSAICCSSTLTARRNVNQCKEQAIITY
jgi:hypothetical protein